MLKDIAQSRQISEKSISRLVIDLRRTKLVRSVRDGHWFTVCFAGIRTLFCEFLSLLFILFLRGKYLIFSFLPEDLMTFDLPDSA